jgi:translocation and assembly module TamA
MTSARAGAALLLAWLLGGCASGSAGLTTLAASPVTQPVAQPVAALPVAQPSGAEVLTLDGETVVLPPEAPPGAATDGAADSASNPRNNEQRLPTLGVDVVIEAPSALRDLLQRHLDLVRLGLFQPGDVAESEWSRLIDATPAQARSLLQTEGYFNPQVLLQRIPGRAQGQADVVRLQVDPGVRAQVGRVTLQPDGALADAVAAGDAYAEEVLAAVREAWALPPGSDFRNPAWSIAKSAVLTRLRAAGFANVAWSGTAAQVDTATNQVRLFLVVDSGPLFRFGGLDIQGLVRHDEQTVQNLAGVNLGTPVSETVLLDFQERLQTAGLFESVTVTLDTDPAQAQAARLLVRLREAPLQTYTFGVGVSANTGPRASVEHIYRRVLGFALTARNRVEWGDKRQAWDGELSTHPGPGQYRNLLGGAVEFLETGDESLLSQRLRLGRTNDTARIERLYFVEAERTLRRTPITRTDAIAFSFNYHGVWRQLDNPILPTRGFTFSGQASVGRSHGNPADSGYFSRVYGRLTGYLPLGRTWYGQARLEVGQVFVPDNVAVPETQLFRAGGDESVRGYGYRSLGPLAGGEVSSGRVLMTTSLELARPFSAALPALWGAVFVDIGNAANSFRNINYVSGTGVGLRYRSPVGPLRLDYAWARETGQGRLHFSVGIAF